RARAEDLTGVARQVVAQLVDGDRAGGAVTEPGVGIAPDPTPAGTAAPGRELVGGIATAYGSATAHSAILARSLGIPAVVGVGEQLLDVLEGAPHVLDGDSPTGD